MFKTPTLGVDTFSELVFYIAGHSIILTLFTGTGVLGMSCLIHEIMPQKNILKDVQRQK